MLGWHISVYRQLNNRDHPATEHSEIDCALAVWQTGLLGMDWVISLAKKSEAVELSNKHYPSLYTAKAKNIIPFMFPTPPFARDFWLCDADDILTEKWLGKTFINTETIAKCSNEEWLLVKAWDEG